jgi:hypothetical protein
MPVELIRPRSWASTRFTPFRAAAAALLCLLVLACAPVQLVADHSSESEKAITDVSASVFVLYDRMIDQKLKTVPEAPLPYAPYAEDWGRIESQLRLIVMREGARPLNSESTRISESILRMWQKFRKAHRDTNDYKLKKLEIDQGHLARNLAAALAAEKAKTLANPDEPPANGN